MTTCHLCNKPFKVGLKVGIPLASLYKDSTNGVRDVYFCATCTKKF